MDTQSKRKNYNKTKDLAPAELIEKTRKATDAAIKALGLKIVRSKEALAKALLFACT